MFFRCDFAQTLSEAFAQSAEGWISFYLMCGQVKSAV